MEEKLENKSDKWTWMCSYRDGLRAVYLPPVTALPVSDTSVSPPLGTQGGEGLSTDSCWNYGTSAAPLPTLLVGRGSMTHFLLGKYFHRKHLSNVRRGGGAV